MSNGSYPLAISALSVKDQNGQEILSREMNNSDKYGSCCSTLLLSIPQNGEGERLYFINYGGDKYLCFR